MASRWSHKHEIPGPPDGVYPRRRLLDPLPSGSKSSLLVIQAAAGYGKTVLAIQILKDISANQKAWLTLERRDSELKRFVDQLLRSLDRCNSKLFGEVISSYRSNAGTADRLLDELSFLCKEHKGAPIWLVLDNWEHVNDEPTVCDFVSRLISGAAGKIKIVITSRVKPAIKLGRLVAGGMATVLQQEDLEFTHAEFEDVANRRLSSPCPPQVLQQIWMQSKGWGIHIGLLVSSLQRIDPTSSTDLGKVHTQTAMEYIVEEVLDGLPGETVDFLVKTSLLNTISLDTCEPLFEDKVFIRTQLQAIRSLGIPMASAVEADTISIHPLVREALKDQIEKRYLPEHKTELIDVLYERLIGADQILDGIELLMGNALHKRALSSIVAHWWTILAENGHGAVKQWLAELPHSVHAEPEFISITSNLHILYADYKTLDQFLTEHFDPDQFKKGSSALGTLWVQHQWARLFVGANLNYTALLEEWKTLEQSHGPFEDYTVAIAEFPLFYTALLESSLEAAANHMRKSLHGIPESKFAIWVTANSNLAVVLVMDGKITEGRETLELLKLACARKASFAVVHHVYAALIRACLLENRYDAMFDTLDEFAHTTRAHPHSMAAVRSQIDSLMGAAWVEMGQTAKGIALLESASDAFKNQSHADYINTSLDLEFVGLTSGLSITRLTDDERPGPGEVTANRLKQLICNLYESALNHDEQRGLQCIAEADQISQLRNVAPWLVTVNLHAMFHHFSMEQYSDALVRLSAAMKSMGVMDWNTYHCAVNDVSSLAIVLAVAKDIQPDRALRLVSGEKRLDLAPAIEQVLSRDTLSDSEKARLVEFALNQRIRGLRTLLQPLSGTSHPELSGLLAQYETAQKNYALPPLQIKVLGNLEVQVDSRPVNIARKKSKMLLEMLSLHHPAPVHEEEIIQHLWPDKDAKSGRANLQTSVSELRKALDPYFEPRGVSYIKLADNCYELSLPDHSSIDYKDLEAGIGRGRSALKTSSGTDTKSTEALERALSLYVGELLPERRYESYTVESREAVRALYLSGVLMLASRYEKESRDVEAEELLNQALQLDPLWTDGIEALIKSLIKQNKHLKALRRYRDYEARMKKELNLAPESSLQALIDKR